MTEFDMFMNEPIVKLQLTFQSSATAPVLLKRMGAFGKRLFERKRVSDCPHETE